MSPNNKHLRKYACPVLEMRNLTQKSELVEQGCTGECSLGFGTESSWPFGFAHITRPGTSLPVTMICLQQTAKNPGRLGRSPVRLVLSLATLLWSHENSGLIVTIAGFSFCENETIGLKRQALSLQSGSHCAVAQR